MRVFCAALVAPWLLLSFGCGRPGTVQAKAETKSAPAAAPAPDASHPENIIRSTGTIQAVRAFSVQVPRIETQNQGPGGGRLTLVRLAQSGVRVNEGDLLAEFDRTPQLDAAREAQARFEDLSHQVRQKAAENRSEAEKRGLEIQQAAADLGKALIQLKKGPVLAEIERLKNEEKAAAARIRVDSLRKIDADRTTAQVAALRILELQTQRQKVALERARSNAETLVVKARMAGMVALENVWRNGSMGAAQEGDQLWPGQTLLKIFDPTEMEVSALISEPDRASLQPGTVAMVNLDAYPEARFRAHFISASPVATAAQGSPIKNFAARFRLLQGDPRLLPDLSAVVLIDREEQRP